MLTEGGSCAADSRDLVRKHTSVAGSVIWRENPGQGDGHCRKQEAWDHGRSLGKWWEVENQGHKANIKPTVCVQEGVYSAPAVFSNQYL